MYKEYKYSLFWQSWSVDRERSSAFSHGRPVNLSFLSLQSFLKKKKVLLVTSLFSSSLPLSSSSLTLPSNVNSPPCAPQPSEQRSRYQEFRQHFRLHFQCLVPLFVCSFSISLSPFLSSCHSSSPLTFSFLFLIVSASWC